MRKLHDRSGLIFSLIWIALYVLGMSAADSISQSFETPKCLTAPFSLLMSGFLFFWLRRNRLTTEYGLCKWQGKAKHYLFFLPLLLLPSVNLWWGISPQAAPAEILFFVISMVCVGFLEEIIFRGFLFKALAKDDLKQAVIISSLTFGIGHILNLFTGSDTVATLIQVVYATAAGFLFTVLFLKTGSLWPCIIAHSAVNTLSIFSPEALSLPHQLLSGGFLCVVSVGYAVYLLRRIPSSRNSQSH